MTGLADSRKEAVSRLSRYLERYGSPRVQLFLILVLTGLVGALCSFAMLQMGLERMWVRYPLAACLAYATFLAVLRLWAQHQLNRPDLATDLERKAAGPGRGKSKSGVDLSLLDFLDVLTVFGDAPVVLLLTAIVVVVLVVIAVLLAAPVLLAEVLLDGLLVAGLWHRFKRQGATESVWGALRATRWPAAIVVLGLGIVGFLLQWVEPSARSIGDVLRSLLG